MKSFSISFVVFVVCFLCAVANAYPYFYDGSPSTWVRGATFNEMGITSFSTSTTACVLSSSGAVSGTLTAGQAIQIQLTSSSGFAYKIATINGGTLSNASPSGDLTESTSTTLNINTVQTSATFTLTAPASGTVTVAALCGYYGESMNVATELTFTVSGTAAPGTAATLAPGTATTAGSDGGLSGFQIPTNLAAHIVLMILAWELLIPVGVVIPLLNNAKHTNNSPLCKLSATQWLKYHWILQVIGVSLGFIGYITGYMSVSSTGGIHFSTFHELLGLLIFLGSIFQPLGGFLRPPKTKTGELKTRARKVFEFGHPIFGYGVMSAGLINGLTGVNQLKVLTGGQPYIFGNEVGSTGFAGPMGRLIAILFTAFVILFMFGAMRSFVNRQRPLSTDLTAYTGGTPAKVARTVSQRELMAHNAESKCWVVYKNRVYDVTEFLSKHPGGKRVIIPYAGNDITTSFNNVGHSSDALNLLSTFLVGDFSGQSASATSTHDIEMGRNNVVTIPQQAKKIEPQEEEYETVINDPHKFLSGGSQAKRKVQLSEKIRISHNVFMLKFNFPDPTMVLGLPVGKHIVLYGPALTPRVAGKWNGHPDPDAGKKEISRKYTPVSSDEKDIGYFTLIVKCYRPDTKFPDGGHMSRFLDSLMVGQSIEISGPVGPHQYLGNGRFLDSGIQKEVRQIAMVCGGSGITPIFQIARAMLLDTSDPCRISLVYANSSHDDILIKTSLDDMEKKHPKRFQVWYTLSQEPTVYWKYSIGRVSKEMLAKRFPPPSADALVISCGPPPMMDSVIDILEQLGYAQHQVIEY